MSFELQSFRRWVGSVVVIGLVGCGPAVDVRDEAPGAITLTPPVGAGSSAPDLAGTPGGGAVMSWLEPAGGEGDPTASTRSGDYKLQVSEYREGAWGPVETVAESGSFFVNWADFPSVTALQDGTWVAHWLQRGSAGGYDYGVRVSHRGPEGWSEPWTPHEDGTPTEHGFVSVIPDDEGYLMAWLDGRETGSEEGAMTLRARWGQGSGPMTEETLLDHRICDCCQTDVARTGEGFVVVYRDRTPQEIRDISIVRWDAARGGWSQGTSVHRDGWMIAGCPVNGPAVAATGSRVAVAWFTGADDDPRVQVAFSDDGGRSFGLPVRLDQNTPIGRVDIRSDERGEVLVSWIEEHPEGGAAIMVENLSADGVRSGAREAARTGSARASGFPRTIRTSEGTLLAWTDDASGQVRALMLPWGKLSE